MKSLANDFLALLAIVALITSIRLYAKDKREAVDKFTKTFTIDKRRPEVADTIKLAQTKDDAADYAADTAIRDAVSPASLANVDADTRAAWLDLVTRTDEELNAAQALMLDAIKDSPGWPYHNALLGRAVYAKNARSLNPDLVRKSDEWRIPLYEASSAASIDDNLWQSLALGYIQTWPDLGRVHEKTATEVFNRAFEDPDFVTNTFDIAVTTIGKKRAVKNLPEKAKPLWAAFQQLAKSGDVLAAWPVHQRWDAAEWRERGEDLLAIEKQWKRGDVDEVRRLCFVWTSTHSIWDYDSTAAHKQAARLLDLWPAGSESSWRSDPRADIVRYFLAGRTEDANGVVLARTVDRIPAVPPPIVARAHVLAGDLTGAEQIAKSAEGFGSFEWTPYMLELARYWNGRRDKTRAGAALAGLAPSARGGCDALMVRHDIEGTRVTMTDQATGQAAGRRPQSALTMTTTGTSGPGSQAALGTPITLCLDGPTSLRVEVLTDTPTIVDYGWDGARRASAFVMTATQPLILNASRQRGMHELTTRAIVGGNATAVVVRSSET